MMRFRSFRPACLGPLLLLSGCIHNVDRVVEDAAPSSSSSWATSNVSTDGSSGPLYSSSAGWSSSAQPHGCPASVPIGVGPACDATPNLACSYGGTEVCCDGIRLPPTRCTCARSGTGWAFSCYGPEGCGFHQCSSSASRPASTSHFQSSSEPTCSGVPKPHMAPNICCDGTDMTPQCTCTPTGWFCDGPACPPNLQCSSSAPSSGPPPSSSYACPAAVPVGESCATTHTQQCSYPACNCSAGFWMCAAPPNACTTEGETRCVAHQASYCLGGVAGPPLAWTSPQPCAQGWDCNATGTQCIQVAYPNTCHTPAECTCGALCDEQNGVCRYTGLVPPTCQADLDCGPACLGAACNLGTHQCVLPPAPPP